MTYKTKLESAAQEQRIYEPKYGGKDHSGYDTKMKYEINDEREECFIAGASWTLKYLSEQGEFREFWLEMDKPDDDDGYKHDWIWITPPDEPDKSIHVIDHQALLASEALRVEAEADRDKWKKLAEKWAERAHLSHDKTEQLETALKVSEAKVAELTKPKEPVYKTHEEYFATITKEIEELTPPNGDLKERE